jgi:predicted hotdog family 3-hydroxylacyl-ACP dehydratase
MRLLDAVDHWDASSIRCRTRSHRDPQHPLLHHDRLSAIAGLEYAAQAIGVHAGLLRGDRQTEGAIGYVGGVRDVVFQAERLDDIQTDLIVEAMPLFEGGDSYLYEFTITADERAVLSGRASIFVKAVPP